MRRKGDFGLYRVSGDNLLLAAHNRFSRVGSASEIFCDSPDRSNRMDCTALSERQPASSSAAGRSGVRAPQGSLLGFGVRNKIFSGYVGLGRSLVSRRQYTAEAPYRTEGFDGDSYETETTEVLSSALFGNGPR